MVNGICNTGNLYVSISSPCRSHEYPFQDIYIQIF